MGHRVRRLVLVAFGLLAAVVAVSAEESRVILPEELRDLQLKHADFILWDARDKTSYDAAHIEGAKLPLDEEFYKASEFAAKGLRPEVPDAAVELKEATFGLDRGRLIVTYCNRNCKASQVLGMQLESLGFKNVKWMEAGLQTWEEKGYPITIGVPKLREN